MIFTAFCLPSAAAKRGLCGRGEPFRAPSSGGAGRACWVAALVMCVFVFAGCTPKKSGPDITQFGLPDAVICEDLGLLPQDLHVYADKAGRDRPLMSKERQAREDERFNQRFFSPWDAGLPRLTETRVFEATKNMNPAKGFAENLRPWNTARWQALVENTFAKAYGNFPVRPAITVTTAHLRRMPTDAPFYLNPGDAGEGFPFDYMQNSVLWAATPVAVIHTSLDGQWVFVQTHLVSGWTRVENLAAVDEAFMKKWRSLPLAVITEDNATLHVAGETRDAVSGVLRAIPANAGMIVPLVVSRDIAPPKSPHVFVHVPLRGADGKAVMGMAFSPWMTTKKKPMPLMPGNVAAVANAMMGQPYGWGGLFGQRDCSAAMHDIFAAFGIWLPRNSRPQGLTGTRLNLTGLSPDEKEARIMRDGIPFFSLVSMKGHVGLYVGSHMKNGREVPVMFHNVWGLRLTEGKGKEAVERRAVIGKAVVTSLRPGAEHATISSPASILDRIAGLAVLPEPFADEKGENQAGERR